MDSFVLYNVPEKEDHVDAKEEVRTQDQENTETAKTRILQRDVSVERKNK